eukprot:9889109-Karenia_brevis.AAC.1
MSHKLDDSLDQAFENMDFKQNRTKANSIALISGANTYQVYNNLKFDQTVGLQREARYSGPVMHWKGSAKPE